ncbi:MULTISPECIES: aspartate aminotransferase family protein [Phyllobacteriaceae]|jgi:glutamate-1-semialdehyde 2,1-aminomutase|uniref:Glutamate-1-semialdehyde 2,1-aminomutase n=1 Tax=Mesorhizobium hungaricum TaxID=1566387 RepID=A0A1C2DK71_9HYPH|nr:MULTISPECIES: glutamate-1-semialdehyde 2,1-aminomutase [Mesorhizobium]MBN9233486.1 glutamate-1-semialdehyde 2,1-aminomutase [Mesorhizobium sp.]MDQ0331824.1 glutamate-1-semialdehyde 2,1-aminomutase [Mesorhizobium sp. YL-MeA3-2017]OCX15055.1 glutamate-1-semialdehyde 2,1-aminomutase [Mesorhizobium hungaricum]
MPAYKTPSRTTRSRDYFARSSEIIPSGVNSTARAVWSGWDPYPLFVDRGTGSHIFDVDGNEYIDYLLGLGPMILGHRPQKITEAVVDFIQNRGTVFAMPAAEEITLSEKIIAAVPAIEQVRLCNTGTEAVLYAVRLARAFTGRKKLIRFEGMYHGFSDGVYWSKHPTIETAGPDKAPKAIPQGPGMPAGLDDSLVILPWNDVEALRDAIAREGHNIAAVITEAVMCNTGCILPEPGYLEAMRDLTAKAGIILICDEVITGFRLSLGGAQGYYGLQPDLSTFAKGLGGGFPVAALGGRKDIMALVADGTVSMAGTYAANGIAVTAANATLDHLATPGLYDTLYGRCQKLFDGLAKVIADNDIPAYVTGVGPVMQLWFADQPIRNYRDAARHARHDVFRTWWEEMLDRGVLFHPGAFENLFISFAHTDDDIAQTVAIAGEAMRAVKAKH